MDVWQKLNRFTLACAVCVLASMVWVTLAASAEDMKARLLRASQRGSREAVRRLLNAGTDPNVTGKGGVTPLMLAAEGGHFSVVRMLLTHGADARAQTINGTSPLLLACENGHVGVARLLVEHGAKVTAGGRWALAIRSIVLTGKLDILRLLVAQGHGISEEIGCIALCAAAEAARQDLVYFLVRKGVDVNCSDSLGITPLMHAVGEASFYSGVEGRATVVRFLVENGADVNAIDQLGWTPLIHSIHWASDKKCDIVKLLVDSGADVNAHTPSGLTPLIACLASSDASICVLKSLLDHGADVNTRTSSGKTPLMEAVAGDAELKHESWLHILRRWLQSFLHPEEMWSGSMPPPPPGLHTTQAVRLLLEKGAQIHPRDKDGCSALDRARQRGDAEIIKLLKMWSRK